MTTFNGTLLFLYFKSFYMWISQISLVINLESLNKRSLILHRFSKERSSNEEPFLI